MMQALWTCGNLAASAQALDAVQIALMDRIDPDPAGPSERLRAAAFPNRDLRRAGRLRDRPAAPGIAARGGTPRRTESGEAGVFWGGSRLSGP